MKRSTLHQVAGVLVEAGRSDLAEKITSAKGSNESVIRINLKKYGPTVIKMFKELNRPLDYKAKTIAYKLKDALIHSVGVPWSKTFLKRVSKKSNSAKKLLDVINKI